MNRLVFDIEGDGLLDTIQNVHCISIKNIDSKEKRTLIQPKIKADILSFLDGIDQIIGHNIIGFDIPLLKMFYGIDLISMFKPEDIIDTYLWSKVLYPDRPVPKGCPTSIKNPVTNKLKKIGAHGLEAWGWRAGQKKIEIHDWRTFNEDIIKRCEIDVDINEKVYFMLLKEAGIK